MHPGWMQEAGGQIGAANRKSQKRRGTKTAGMLLIKERGKWTRKNGSGIPEGFSGKLLEIPVGTGVLTMPLYRRLPKAQITCVDYAPEMLERAQRQGKELSNVRFQQGDVGDLPFQDGSFDGVLSLNGFHAFPDKEAAWKEVFRVLKPGGTFCGCFYVQGKNRRTDWLIRQVYVKKGFFTPPFETGESLQLRLERTFGSAKVSTVQSIASFVCKKEKTEYR